MKILKIIILSQFILSHLQKAIYLTIVRLPMSLGWTRRLEQEICE